MIIVEDVVCAATGAVAPMSASGPGLTEGVADLDVDAVLEAEAATAGETHGVADSASPAGASASAIGDAKLAFAPTPSEAPSEPPASVLTL
jgi:hypothetical protein